MSQTTACTERDACLWLRPCWPRALPRAGMLPVRWAFHPAALPAA